MVTFIEFPVTSSHRKLTLLTIFSITNIASYYQCYHKTVANVRFIQRCLRWIFLRSITTTWAATFITDHWHSYWAAENYTTMKWQTLNTRNRKLTAGIRCRWKLHSVTLHHYSKQFKPYISLCIDHDSILSVQLFHDRTRTAYLYRCVWSGITGR